MIETFRNHFVAYHILMLKCRFKQPSQQIAREHMLFPCMQRFWIIVMITCVTQCSFFWCVFFFTRQPVYPFGGYITVVVEIQINANFDTLGPRQDDHNFAYHFQIRFFFFFIKTTKKSTVQFVPKGAVDHKWKLVQAMAWRRSDTEPLPESVMIHVNGAYIISWIDWVDDFTVFEIYIYVEKNGTVWAHEGYLHLKCL